MPDIDDLTYFEVVRTVSPIPGGALSADVVFEAQVTRGLAFQADVSSDVIEILVRPVKARIVDGVLMKDGAAGVQLLSSAEVAIDGGFSYLATFTNVRVDGKAIPTRDELKSLSFEALDGVGTFDLKDAAPVPTSTATPTARGPRGLGVDLVTRVGNTLRTWVQGAQVGNVDISDLVFNGTFDSITDSTTVGKAVGRASNQAAGRTALGASTVGAGVFTAVDAATARISIGALDAGSVMLIPLSNYLAPGQAMPNDGVTDAAPLINTAMADLLAKANGPQPYGQICYVLDLGPGRFLLTDEIQPGGGTPTVQNAHVGIQGAAKNQTFILPQGATSGIIFNQVDDSQPSAVDCHFSDFTVDLKDATLGPGGSSRKGFIGRGWVDSTWTRVDVNNSPATAFGCDFPVRCRFTACQVNKTSTGVDGTLDMSAGVIEAAKFFSGFGFGFGVFDDESVVFDGCDATNCFRGGFFFEAFEASLGHTKRTAVIQMIGCKSWNNRVGVTNVGSGSLVATNCQFVDNTVAGYYGGVSGGTTQIASLNTTLDNCQLLRNGYALYATGDFTGAGHNYTALRDVLGGYRILNCRIEDNTLGGLVAERFNTIEAGGLTVRGNHFRRNGGAGGIMLRQAVGPVRDMVIESNYFDANDNIAMQLLVALNAPKITGNTFCNSDGGSTQTVGIKFHPAEPITAPLVDANTFRRIATPMVNADRLDLTATGDRILDSTGDPDSPWLYREALYGRTGAWPVSGDGWAKNTGGSNADWNFSSVGAAKGGSGTALSYIYRDLGTTGVYVEAKVTSTTDAAALTEFIGVMHSLASSSVRTALVAGVNGAGVGNAATSNFYALWQVVGGTWTLLWESAVPFSEGHTVALARLAGSTVTDMFIDGELVHSVNVTAVPVTSLAGVSGAIVTNQKRYLADFRAMKYTNTAPPPTGPSALTVAMFADAAITTEAEKITAHDNDTSLPTSAAVLDLLQRFAALQSPTAYVSGSYYYCNSASANATSNALTADRARTSAWLITAPLTIATLTAEFTAAGDANSVFRIGIWNDDGFGRPGTLLLDAGSISTGTGNAGTVATGGTPGEYEVTASLTIPPGLYHVGGAVQGVTTTQPTMRLIAFAQCPHTGPAATSLGPNHIGTGWYKDAVTGALGSLATPTKNTSTTTVAPRIGFKAA